MKSCFYNLISYSKSPATAIRNFIPSILLPLAPVNFLNNTANASISPENTEQLLVLMSGSISFSSAKISVFYWQLLSSLHCCQRHSGYINFTEHNKTTMWAQSCNSAYPRNTTAWCWKWLWRYNVSCENVHSVLIPILLS